MLLLLLLFPLSVLAQDTIIRTDGEEISCKILEISDAKVHFSFKKGNRDIKSYLDKSKVHKIIYEDGRSEELGNELKKPGNRTDGQGEVTVQDSIIQEPSFWGSTYYYKGEPMGLSDLRHIMAGNQDAYDKMSGARTAGLISMILGAAGGFCTGYGIGNALFQKDDMSTAGVLMIVGGGLIAASIPFAMMSESGSEEAVKLYNAGLNSTAGYDPMLKIGFTANGIGLQVQF